MRNFVVIALVIVLGLALVTAGTILAQDTEEEETSTATPWLGINYYETDAGVVVARVTSGSPAAAGGLLIGDLFVSFDSNAVESGTALADMVADHAPGDVVEVVVIRHDTERTLEIELGSQPVRQTGRPHSTRSDVTRESFSLADVDPASVAAWMLHVRLDTVETGYEVTAVMKRTDDSDATLQVGDVITAINEVAVTDVDWTALLTELDEADEPILTLTVMREDEELSIEYTPTSRFHGLQSLNGIFEDLGDSSRGGSSRGHGHQEGFFGGGASSSGTTGSGGAVAPAVDSTPA